MLIIITEYIFFTVGILLFNPDVQNRCGNGYAAVSKTIVADPSRQRFGLMFNYENPSDANFEIRSSSNEAIVDIPSNDKNYYWMLPLEFSGDKSAYHGGFLNYTVRSVSSYGDGLPRNVTPDVIIRSTNDVTLFHYHHGSQNKPNTSQTHSVLINETAWRFPDGSPVNGADFLTVLKKVEYFFVRATYTTNIVLTALSEVRLAEYQCICNPGYTGSTCKECIPGYTYNQGGLNFSNFNSNCELCSCNGHSNDCHPKTGICQVRID